MYLTTQPLFVCDTQSRQDVTLSFSWRLVAQPNLTIIPININRSLQHRQAGTYIHMLILLAAVNSSLVSVREVPVYAGFLSLLCNSSITPSG